MRTAAHNARSWLVVHTHPHREHVAIENLVRQDFETCCRRMHRILRARTGPREVLRPLFPNYVFVQGNPADRMMWRLVRFGEQVPMPDAGFIDALRARAAYEVGQEVRISGGAFDGIVARIIEAGPNDRLLVLMDLLGQSVRGRIPAGQVTPSLRI